MNFSGIRIMSLAALATAGLMLSENVNAQSQDPVLMTVNGVDITRSEFEYSFNKNNSDGVIDKKGLQEYVPLFEAFKLKVEAAKAAGIDTLESVRKELIGFKQQIVYPTVVDTGYIEKIARETYDTTAKRFGDDDILTASHILVLMRQDATEEQQTAAKARIDSIYAVLQTGADFAEVAKACSDDKASAVEGGSLGQFGKGMMIPDFENAAYALQAGQMSAPVKSTVGWHIIKLTDRHQFEPYEFHREKILAFLKQRGIEDAASKYYVDSIAKLKGLPVEDVVEELFQQVTAEDSELKNLAQEYYDGTLMYEMVKTNIWDPASNDTEGLANYFKTNKKNYTWDAPRFKGVVLFAKDAETLAKAQKIAKKVKSDDTYTIADAVVKALNTDSVKVVRVEHGIYKQGDSQNVDVQVFKSGTELKPKKDYPEVMAVGKVLKAPKVYTDVKGQVVSDYQMAKEREWVEQLRQKYPITVNQEVLNTVNNHE